MGTNNWQTIAIMTGLVVNATVLISPLIRVANRLELLEFRVIKIERILERQNRSDATHQNNLSVG